MAASTTMTLQQNPLQVAEVEAEAAVVAEDKVLVGVPVVEKVPPGTTTRTTTATVSIAQLTAHCARTSKCVQKPSSRLLFVLGRNVAEMPT